MQNLSKAVLWLFVFLMVSGICRAEDAKDIDAAIESITAAAIKEDFQEVMSIFAVLIEQPGLSVSQRAQIYYLRGWAYQMLAKDYALAIKDYSHSIELEGDVKWTFSSYVNRAGCYLDLKQYEKALEDVDKALEISPEHPVATNKKNLILNTMQSVQEESEHVL